jgi:hypothetical protein
LIQLQDRPVELSLDSLRSLTGHSKGEMLADFTPYRDCDHTLMAFLIADGVPGSVGRNCVCRMIIRAAR